MPQMYYCLGDLCNVLVDQRIPCSVELVTASDPADADINEGKSGPERETGVTTLNFSHRAHRLMLAESAKTKSRLLNPTKIGDRNLAGGERGAGSSHWPKTGLPLALAPSTASRTAEPAAAAVAAAAVTISAAAAAAAAVVTIAAAAVVAAAKTLCNHHSLFCIAKKSS